MGISETLNKNKPVAFGVIGAIIVVSGIVMFMYLKGDPMPGSVPGNVWFMDVTTGDKFIRAEQLAPVPPPSGATDADGDPAGAKLVRYGCGSCDSPFEGHLEKYSADAKATLAPVFNKDLGFTWNDLPPSVRIGYEEARDNGRYIAKVEMPVQWVKASSKEGAAIFAEIGSKCAGSAPTECDASH